MSSKCSSSSASPAAAAPAPAVAAPAHTTHRCRTRPLLLHPHHRCRCLPCRDRCSCNLRRHWTQRDIHSPRCRWPCRQSCCWVGCYSLPSPLASYPPLSCQPLQPALDGALATVAPASAAPAVIAPAVAEPAVTSHIADAPVADAPVAVPPAVSSRSTCWRRALSCYVAQPCCIGVCAWKSSLARRSAALAQTPCCTHNEPLAVG